MRPSYLCLAILLSTAVAGCITDEAPPPAAGEAQVALVESVYHLELEGAPGDWVFVYLPYVNATQDLRGGWDWHVVTEPAADQEHHVVWLAPAWVDAAHGRQGFGFADRIEAAGQDAFEDEASWSWGFGTSGDPSSGESFAFGSDAAWKLDVRLEIESGAAGYGEPVVVHGSNATAALHDPDVVLGIDPAGSYEAAGTFDVPGWHIVTFIDEPVQPLAVRDYTITIPEESVDQMGTRYGHQTPAGGSAFSSGMNSGLGVFNGTAGDWSASVTYAEAKWDLPLLVFDLPGGDGWPAWAEAPYRLSQRPFHDGPTPPLPPVDDVWFERR